MRWRPELLSDPAALYNLALVLSEGLGRPEEALELVDRLQANIGPAPMILGARGVILTRLDRLDEAIATLDRSVSLDPSAERHYYLARAYHRAGHTEQFREHLEQALQDGLEPEAIDPWQRDEMRSLLSL